jgi:hypothetical protein
MLLPHPAGNYHFLVGIDPYSCGVIADPGYEVTRLRLAAPLPWRAGFARVAAHLATVGRPLVALCGVELRSPAPTTMAGFIAFNRPYCDLLHAWGLSVGTHNPVARTNVAPVCDPPDEVVLHAFSYTTPAAAGGPTFIVAGAGELREGLLEEERIICRGQDSPAARLAKAAYVMQVMTDRLHGLGADWNSVTAVNVYAACLDPQVATGVVASSIGPARRVGTCWHWTRPPVLGIDFEMDLRGVVREQVI